MRILLAFFLVCPLFSGAQSITDQTYREQGLVTLRSRLHLAALAKDTAMLRPLLADSLLGHDRNGPMSREDFLKDVATSHDYFWNDLLHAMRFGFAPDPWSSSEHAFVAPSYLPGHDASSQVLITAGGVRIREHAGYGGRVLGVASFEVLECDCGLGESFIQEVGGEYWQPVWYKGQEAFVRLDLTSAAYNYIIQAEEVDGSWVLTWVYVPYSC